MTEHPEQHRKLWLENLVRDNNFTVGAEIGVHEGVTYFHLIDTFPHLKMYGVDPYKYQMEKQWPGMRKQLTLRGWPNNPKTTFLKMTSDNACREVRPFTLDFVFIDALHSKWAVYNDIRLWYNKVRPGGYIIGHDYSKRGVYKAVKLYFEENWFELNPNGPKAPKVKVPKWDDLWYVQKPDG